MKKLNKTLDILEPASDESLESLAKSGIIRLVDEERDHAQRMVDAAVTRFAGCCECPPNLEFCIQCVHDHLTEKAKEALKS